MNVLTPKTTMGATHIALKLIETGLGLVITTSIEIIVYKSIVSIDVKKTLIDYEQKLHFVNIVDCCNNEFVEAKQVF